MLKYYIKTTEALRRLRTDKDGVVSFEYVIVAAVVVAAVVAAFVTNPNGISGTLTTAIGRINAAIVAAVPAG
jgi:pilus assembly protein Flp/PilA